MKVRMLEASIAGLVNNSSSAPTSAKRWSECIARGSLAPPSQCGVWSMHGL